MFPAKQNVVEDVSWISIPLPTALEPNSCGQRSILHSAVTDSIQIAFLCISPPAMTLVQGSLEMKSQEVLFPNLL